MTDYFEKRRTRASKRVVVVSGDLGLVRLIARHYRSQGCKVQGIPSVAESRAELGEDIDFVVFDLSGQNDRASLVALREALAAPVIVVSSGVEEASSEAISDLLRAGADRVISRPFTLEAFDAHVAALAETASERQLSRPGRRPYIYLDLVVDFKTAKVALAVERVHLSALQYKLVEFLARNAGAVTTVHQISDAVWGPGYEATSELVRSHVRNIRRLLDDPASEQRFLKTENHIGYWMPRGGNGTFPTSLSESPALREVLDNTLDLCIEAVQADMGNIQVLDGSNNALIIVSQRGFEADFLEHFRTVAVGDGSACSLALELGERVVIEDITMQPAYLSHLEVALRAGYRAVQSTPVNSRSGTLGVISTHFRKPHAPSASQLHLIDLSAGILGRFLDQSRQLTLSGQ